MSRFCIHCGAKLRTAARFCTGCGRTVHRPHAAAEQRPPFTAQDAAPGDVGRSAPAQVPPPPATLTVQTTALLPQTALPDEGTVSGVAFADRLPGFIEAGRGWLGAVRPGMRCGAEGGAAFAPAARVSNRRMYAAFGLCVVGFFTSGDHISTGFIAKTIFLAWLVVTAVVVLESFGPRWYPRSSSWLSRPHLGAVAAAIYALTGAMAFGIGFSNIFWISGALLFISDVKGRGELGSFEPRLLLRGVRLLLIAGIFLASLMFGEAWNSEMSGEDTVRSDMGDGDGWVTEYSYSYESGGENAYVLGKSATPSLLMLGVLAWACWTGGAATARRWMRRLLPLGLAALLFLWNVKQVIGSYLEVAGLPTSVHSSSSYGSVSSILLQAAGPIWFLFLSVPFYLAVIILTLKRNPWPQKPTG
jgi:hypothetical protein